MGGYARGIAVRPGTPSHGRSRAHGVPPVCALFNRCQIRHPLPASAGARLRVAVSAHCPTTPQTDRAFGIDQAPGPAPGKTPLAHRSLKSVLHPRGVERPNNHAACRHNLSFQHIRVRHLFRRHTLQPGEQQRHSAADPAIKARHAIHVHAAANWPAHCGPVVATRCGRVSPTARSAPGAAGPPKRSGNRRPRRGFRPACRG